MTYSPPEQQNSDSTDWTRLLQGILVAMITGAVLSSVGLIWGIPALVEYYAKRQLGRLMHGECILEVEVVTPWSTEVSGFQFIKSPWQISVQKISLQYSPEGLKDELMESVFIQDFDFKVSLPYWFEGDVIFSEDTNQVYMEERLLPSFKLPVKTIRIVDGSGQLSADEKAGLNLLFNGAVNQDFDGRLSFSLDTLFENNELYLEGGYETEAGFGEIFFHFRGNNTDPLLQTFHTLVPETRIIEQFSVSQDFDSKGAVHFESGNIGNWGVTVDAVSSEIDLVDYQFASDSLFLGSQGRGETVNALTLSGKKIQIISKDLYLIAENSLIDWDKSGHLMAELPRLSLKIDDSISLDLSLLADLRLDFADDAISGRVGGPKFDLDVDNESFQGGNFEIRGTQIGQDINVSLKLDRLSFLELLAENLQCEIRITGYNSIEIKELTFSGMDGQFQLNPFVIADTENAKLKTKLRFSGINLRKLNTFLKLFDGEVDGMADGWLTFSWNEQRLTLHDGLIVLNKENPGFFRYINPGWLTGGQKAKGLVQTQLNLAEKTMEDMKVEKFTVDLFPDNYPDKDLRVEIYGHGSDGDPKKVVDYGANFTVPTGILTNNTIRKMINLGIEIAWERDDH